MSSWNDLFMWHDLPHHDPAAIAPTSMDALDNTTCFEKYEMNPAEAKGAYGVRVRRRLPREYLVDGVLPEGTFVGAYPGRIYPDSLWDDAAAKGKRIGRLSSQKAS
jgi:hypothetical protein